MHRRTLLLGLGLGLVGAGLGGRPLLAADRIEPTQLEAGFYSQKWFLNSFLDLAEDFRDATAAGKRFAIIWEQAGCPYCRDLHTINFADPDVNTWIEQRFAILQLNLFGSREVTDFDGEVLTERKLALKYRVNFTPTIQFFPASEDGMTGKSGAEAEIFRMPGYFRPFHFISAFEYVHGQHYRDQDFQSFLGDRGAKARDAGIAMGKPLPMN